MPSSQTKQKSTTLRGRTVPYQLRVSQRRTLGLTVTQDGLKVAAPKGLALGQIEQFLQQHADWVLEKLAARPQPTRFLVAHGAELPLLGRRCAVHIESGGNRVRLEDDGQQAQLIIAAKPEADEATLARLAVLGLQRHALPIFAQRLAAYAQGLGRPAPTLGLTNARTRWGSCSSRSGIRLHWRLIHLPLHLIDYVVAHELAHLNEMNHSPRFWAVVASIYPDYQQARRELKRAGAALPHF